MYFTDILGFTEKELERADRFAEEAEEIYNAVCEFAERHCEEALDDLQDFYKITSSDYRQSFADMVTTDFRENVSSEQMNDLLGWGASVINDTLNFYVSRDTLIKALDLEFSVYDGGIWDSHFYLGDAGEVFCGNDVIDTLAAAYQKALKGVYIKYAKEKHADKPDFIQFIEETALDSIEALYNNELWDDFTQATIAIEDYAAIGRGECPDLQELLDKDLKECYAEFAERDKEQAR